jgi:hypothetical protein
MITLLKNVVTNAQALTVGQLFPARGGGIQEISYHLNVMPPRIRENDDDVVPFCLARVQGFAILPRRSQKIELLYGLHNDDRAEALEDIARLLTLLDPLATKLTVYNGWKMESVSGWLGDRETGMQPHPEYYVWIIVEFIGQLIRSH